MDTISSSRRWAIVLAVIALSTALGPGKPAEALLKEAEPDGVEPWAETLLFGSAGDVKKLLDGGLDPNSSTKDGRVTALMLATPDVEKMKLLIERGANVEARTKHKYSPRCWWRRSIRSQAER